MKDQFLGMKDHVDVARFFGIDYEKLALLLYKTPGKYNYVEFHIPKRNGGVRPISAPRKKLKAMQRRLADVLYEIYPGRPSAHGFARHKSVVTNSASHLDKSYVFNVDLKDFFGSIHFGRIRNLFMSLPFNFPRPVATILAQLCCHSNSLPQGAPTSPILTNMLAWKLDAQLQKLARICNATYTRYADDITFSFTCSLKRLPAQVLTFHGGVLKPGGELLRIIDQNGFELNSSKTRLAGTGQRMEVTGVTVNKFPNVTRRYIRQIASMLYAWEKFGYGNANREFNERYDSKSRASGKPKQLMHVLRGKLSFLRSVRGKRDPIFGKLAARYNALVPEVALQLRLFEETEPEKNAINSLWVIEFSYDDSLGMNKTSQGTGFMLSDFGLITCAHVVADIDRKEVYEELAAHQVNAHASTYPLKVKHIDYHRDIAICDLIASTKENMPTVSLDLSTEQVAQGIEVRLLGFPAYRVGQTPYIADTKIASTFPESGVQKFEVESQIRSGNSGGPLIDRSGRLIGVALKGATREDGKNAALSYTELSKIRLEWQKTNKLEKYPL